MAKRTGKDLHIGQRITVLHDEESADGFIEKPYPYQKEAFIFTAYEDHPWLHAGDLTDQFNHRHWIIFNTYTEGKHFIVNESSIGIDELI